MKTLWPLITSLILFFSFIEKGLTRSPAVEPVKRISYAEEYRALYNSVDDPKSLGADIASGAESITLVKPGASHNLTFPWVSLLTLFTVFIALPLSVFWGLRQSLKNNQENLDYSQITPPGGEVIQLDSFRIKETTHSASVDNVIPLHKKSDEHEEDKKKVS
jgi:hypothetical protein